MAPLRPLLITAALAVTLLVEAVLFVVLLHGTDLAHRGHLELFTLTSGPVWLLALVLLARLRLTPRRAGLLVLGVGAVLQIIALTHRPATSDDDYRYIWDAKVQLAGVDPYAHAPSSPALERLRDPALFGAPDHCTWTFPGGCTSINRPTVRTIYPPVAQAALTAVRIVSFGGHGGHLPLQLAGALGCLVIGGLVLRRTGRPWLAAVWTWCPVTVLEYGNNAHIDWLGVLLVVLALSARGMRTAGVLVGAAIAVKLYPALVLPSLMRRSWTAAVAALAFVVLVYVPHLIAVGGAVIGYLPGYLHEENYGSGNRLLLLGAILPHPLDTVVGVLVLAAVALWAWRRGAPGAPQRSAVVVVGVALLVITPEYSWYAGLLLALVALTGAVEWLPVVFAATYVYAFHSQHATLTYTGALVLTIAIAAVGNVGSLRACLRSISPTTDRSPSSPSMPRR